MRLINKLLLGALLLITCCGTVQAQKLRFPANVRYIANGYIDQTPYFGTLRGALNNVKAFATLSNPYVFCVDGDTSRISDWRTGYNHGLSMKDSVDQYYVATGKIKWAGFSFGGSGSIFIPSTDKLTLHYNVPSWTQTNNFNMFWQKQLGQALDTLDQRIWDLIIYVDTSYLYIQNDTLKVKSSPFQGGVTYFNSSDTTVSVLVTGAHITDNYIATPKLTGGLTTQINSNDMIFIVPSLTGFTAKRKPGGSANLYFTWIRK